MVLSERSVLVGCALALLIAACASPAGSESERPWHTDSPTAPRDGPRFPSDRPADLSVTTEPSEQLVEWVGPFTTWLEMGLPIQITQPPSLDSALGTVPGPAPDGVWNAQPPSETPSTAQPATTAADLASDRGDENGLQDTLAELPVTDPPPAAVDGNTATRDQAKVDGGNQTVESDRCQEWQPRPGDELRPCMGGPQFAP